MTYYVQLMRAFAARAIAAIAANPAVGARCMRLNNRVHADATWSLKTSAP